MDKSTVSQNLQPIKFNLKEFSGSLGDLGLFIPLVVAMTVSCDLDIGIVLIFAGLMNIITGWIFRQPIPVQPMKALAAIVITESMLKEELFAAGILMGLILICLSVFIEKINQWVPKSVVRGIQLGVGIKLILKGVQWISDLPLIGMNSLLTALLIAGLLILLLSFKRPALLYVFLLGCVLLYAERPEVYSSLTFQLPKFDFHMPSWWAFKYGFLKGVLPQLPLTILNSVIAVCALSADYFPQRGIAPRKMAMSVGLMNLIAVPFGGIPMCHGAGGLAAQYRFGARTGGSVIMLGTMKVLLGLIFGHALFMLLQAYPMSILGVMLIFAGGELSKSAKDSFDKPNHIIILVVTGGLIILYNTFIGFLGGMCMSFIIFLIQRSRQHA